MKRMCVMALLAAGGPAAYAQPDLDPEVLREGFLDPATLPPGVHAASPYSGRTLTAAYDNWTGVPTATVRGALARTSVADDFRFAPIASSPTVARVGFAVGQSAGNPAQNVDVLLQIYSSNITSPVCIPGSTWIWERRLSVPLPANPFPGGVFYRLESDVESARLSDLDGEFTFVQQFPNVSGATAPTIVVASARTVGFSDPKVYRDVNANGCIEASEGTPGTTDIGLVFKLEYVAGLCEYDLNGDGNVDQGDVDVIVSAVAGDLSGLRTDVPIELDKNQDGNVDQEDVEILLTGLEWPYPC